MSRLSTTGTLSYCLILQYNLITFTEAKSTTTNKYVAPFMREGGAGRGAGREPPGARRDDVAAIRISNLSNFAVEADLDDLVKGFGPVQKLYLAKEKVTYFRRLYAYLIGILKNSGRWTVAQLLRYWTTGRGFVDSNPFALLM